MIFYDKITFRLRTSGSIPWKGEYEAWSSSKWDSGWETAYIFLGAAEDAFPWLRSSQTTGLQLVFTKCSPCRRSWGLLQSHTLLPMMLRSSGRRPGYLQAPVQCLVDESQSEIVWSNCRCRIPNSVPLFLRERKLSRMLWLTTDVLPWVPS